jgi:hypothetical protein
VARIRSVVAALVALLAVTLPNTKATFSVEDSWKVTATTAIVAAYRGPKGETLAVTRAQVPNADAWREKTRAKYIDDVERGALAAIKGAKRISHKVGEANGVPVLDLEVKREDGATIVIRYLLFRTYALALAIEIPKGGSPTEARTITGSFAPPAS